jgi:hypothetical protein
MHDLTQLSIQSDTLALADATIPETKGESHVEHNNKHRRCSHRHDD